MKKHAGHTDPRSPTIRIGVAAKIKLSPPDQLSLYRGLNTLSSPERGSVWHDSAPPGSAPGTPSPGSDPGPRRAGAGCLPGAGAGPYFFRLAPVL